MRIKKDALEKMIGFTPSKQMRIDILKEVREGKTLQEAAAKWNLGEMAVLDDNGKFLYEGKRITPEEWRKINPLGEFGKIVIIGTRERIKKYQNNKNQK